MKWVYGGDRGRFRLKGEGSEKKDNLERGGGVKLAIAIPAAPHQIKKQLGRKRIGLCSEKLGGKYS